MLTIPDLLNKADCFVWGHDFDRGGVCVNCGAKRGIRRQS